MAEGKQLAGHFEGAKEKSHPPSDSATSSPKDGAPKENSKEPRKGVPDADADILERVRAAPFSKIDRYHGVGTNYGSSTINVNYGGLEPPLELALREIKTLPEFEYHTPTQEVSEFLERLREKRLLIIEGSKLGAKIGRAAALSLFKRLQNEISDLKHFQGCSEVYFPLQAFLTQQSWRNALERSVIYLDSSADSSTISFSEIFAESLTEAFSASDCYLLVFRVCESRRDTTRTSQMMSFVPVWRVNGTKADVDNNDESALRARLTDPLGAALCTLAALFPGLAPSEFTTLAGKLLALIPTPESRKPVTAQKTEEDPSPQDGLERWNRGERDFLIADFGVSFRKGTYGSLDEGMATPPGYYFSNALEAGVCRDLLYDSAPLLLAEYLPVLTDWYFNGEPSSRFESGYHRYVMGLHSAHICRLTGQTLGMQYRENVSAPRPIDALRRQLALFRYVADHEDGPEILNDALDEIARHSHELEDVWMHSLVDRGYFRHLSEVRGEADDNSTPGAMEWRALGLCGLQDKYQEAWERLGVLYQFLLLMLERAPDSVIRALVTGLAGSDMRMNFAHAAQGEAYAGVVTVPSLASFENALSRIAEDVPTILIRCCELLIETSGASADGGSEKAVAIRPNGLLDDGVHRRAVVRWQMQYFCLSTYRSIVESGIEGRVSEEVIGRLLGDNDQSSVSQTLATMLLMTAAAAAVTEEEARKPTVPIEPGDVVTLYAPIAQALLQRSVKEGRDDGLERVRHFC
ncbi:hypothetical protein [Paraburkholderia terrae]